MKLKFTKMQGAGNDYIYFDCMRSGITDISGLAERLSDRHFGIGGDGIVLICPSSVANARMRMFNADGSEGRMCGNAIRCVAKYLYDNGRIKSEKVSIETLSGIKQLTIKVADGCAVGATVNMGLPEFSAEKIPCMATGIVKNHSLCVCDGEYLITAVSMGNPHAVTFVKDVAGFDVATVGRAISEHPFFPDRVNAEFAEYVSPTHLNMRVYERGSGETLACGTGACATVAAAVSLGKCEMNKDIKVSLLGGELIINYTENGVYMTGNAVKVFDGEVEI